MLAARTLSISKLLLSLGLLSCFTCIAQGQVIRTWVSEFGVDTGTCPKSAPCHTFNYAMTQTVAGGEVVALDSGGFNPATITKSISLIADHGVFAGSSPVAVNAITIAAGDNDRVILRGLNLEGKGGNLNGIHATNFGSLFIEDCKINGFGGASSVGIHIAPTGATPHYVSIKNTEIRNNKNEGISILGGLGGPLTILIEDSRIEKNNYGIAGGAASITLRGSVISGQLNAGISPVGILVVNVVGSSISHNGKNGIETNAFMPATAGTVFRLTNSSLNNNGACGVFVNAPAVVETISNNLIAGNTAGQVCGGVLTPTPAADR